MTDKEYYQHFDEKRYLCFGKEEKRKNALEIALETRKFEIELYWKRTTYFWAFIVSIYIAYYNVYTIESTKLLDFSFIQPAVLIALSFLGCFFSLAWLMVNKGSKFWQKNWETHVDLLEDKIMGPLFSIYPDSDVGSSINPFREYGFSVSKVNMAASLVLTILSALFFWWNIHQNFFNLICKIDCNKCFCLGICFQSCLVSVAILLMMGGILFFFCRGNTEQKNVDKAHNLTLH